MQTLQYLVRDEQPIFGQFKRVETINYLDAHITRPSGRALNQRAKKRKANQFCFIGIDQQDYMIGMAVADIKWVSNAFVYVYDKNKQRMIQSHLRSPFAHGTRMGKQPNNGTIAFSRKKNQLTMHFTQEQIQLCVKTKHIQLQANISPSKEPMCLCTRAGYTGWVYMQKQNALDCTGELSLPSAQVPLDTHNCRANIDWTLGYMQRETFWNWASINTRLPEGCVLGLNLVCGVNDTGYSENALWLDGKLINLPPSIFLYNPQDVMQPWQICSNTQVPTNRKVQLTFTPITQHQDHTDIVFLASHFSQLIGIYNGTVQLADKNIVLNNVWGLAENHYAKW